MRKFIIDTDTASDDAAALVMAAFEKNIELLGVTTVAGNVSLPQATLNALATLEVCNCDVPVYKGAAGPLFGERPITVSVHGEDGMGDCSIINPSRKPCDRRAVDFILDTVSKYPGEVEIAALGPATNIALAVLTDREIMKKVKHIWSMSTPGFGPGNVTPVAEFNVFNDAHAYALMLESGIPVTIIGFDLCGGDIGIDKSELALMANGSSAGRFLEKATRCLLEFNIATRKLHIVDLADAVAMAVALWDGFVLDKVNCRCKCCTERNETYGQVIFYREDALYEAFSGEGNPTACVITKVDVKMFKEKFMELML